MGSRPALRGLIAADFVVVHPHARVCCPPQALGKIVFADKAKMQLLNTIVWPPTLELIQQQLQRFRVSGGRTLLVCIGV